MKYIPKFLYKVNQTACPCPCRKGLIRWIRILSSAVVDVRGGVSHGRIAGGVDKLWHRGGIWTGSRSGNGHGNGQESGEEEEYLWERKQRAFVQRLRDQRLVSSGKANTHQLQHDDERVNSRLDKQNRTALDVCQIAAFYTTETSNIGVLRRIWAALPRIADCIALWYSTCIPAGQVYGSLRLSTSSPNACQMYWAQNSVIVS